MVISFHASDGPCGEIFLVHGHQGTLDSDFFHSSSHWFVHTFYSTYQIMTGKGRTTPAMDACLRSQHDIHMYRWASKQENLILIAGHTHRPVWTSKTHLDQLMDQLWSLMGQIPSASGEETTIPENQDHAEHIPATMVPANRALVLPTTPMSILMKTLKPETFPNLTARKRRGFAILSRI